MFLNLNTDGVSNFCTIKLYAFVVKRLFLVITPLLATSEKCAGMCFSYCFMYVSCKWNYI